MADPVTVKVFEDLANVTVNDGTPTKIVVTDHITTKVTVIEAKNQVTVVPQKTDVTVIFNGARGPIWAGVGDFDRTAVLNMLHGFIDQGKLDDLLSLKIDETKSGLEAAKINLAQAVIDIGVAGQRITDITLDSIDKDGVVSRMVTTVDQTEDDVIALQSKILQAEDAIVLAVAELNETTGKVESAQIAIASDEIRMDVVEETNGTMAAAVNLMSDAWTIRIQEDQDGNLYTAGAGLMVYPNWAADTEYFEEIEDQLVADFVWFNGEVYQCIADHVSAVANEPPNVAYWLHIPYGVKSAFGMNIDSFYIKSAGYPDLIPFAVSTRGGVPIIGMEGTVIIDGTLSVDSLIADQILTHSIRSIGWNDVDTGFYLNALTGVAKFIGMEFTIEYNNIKGPLEDEFGIPELDLIKNIFAPATVSEPETIMGPNPAESRLPTDEIWTNGEATLTDISLPGVTGGRYVGEDTDCSGALTYAEALAWADLQGGRLPTRAECILGVGTGCMYNGEYTWTTESSTPGKRWCVYGDPAAGEPDVERLESAADTYVTLIGDDVLADISIPNPAYEPVTIMVPNPDESAQTASAIWDDPLYPPTYPTAYPLVGCNTFDPDGNCPSGLMTYAAAKAYVESFGARLPKNVDELQGCKATGCNLDHDLCWTSDQDTAGKRWVEYGDILQEPTDAQEILETATAGVRMVAEIVLTDIEIPNPDYVAGDGEDRLAVKSYVDEADELIKTNFEHTKQAVLDMEADGVFSVAEKKRWAFNWVGMMANFDAIRAAAVDASVSVTTLDEKQSALNVWLNTTHAVFATPPVASNFTTTDFETLTEEYYEELSNTVAATSTAIAEERADRAATSGNFLDNSDFQSRDPVSTYPIGTSGGLAVGADPVILGERNDDIWNLVGTKALSILQNSGTTAGYFILWLPSFTVEPGGTYNFSVYTGAHHCNVMIVTQYRDSAGNPVAGPWYSPAADQANDKEKWGGSVLSSYKRNTTISEAPATAATAHPYIVKYATSTVGMTYSYAFLHRAMFVKVPNRTTTTPPWAPKATNAAEVFDAGMETLTGGIKVTDSSALQAAHLTGGDLKFYQYNPATAQLAMVKSVRQTAEGTCRDGQYEYVAGPWPLPPNPTPQILLSPLSMDTFSNVLYASNPNSAQRLNLAATGAVVLTDGRLRFLPQANLVTVSASAVLACANLTTATSTTAAAVSQSGIAAPVTYPAGVTAITLTGLMDMAIYAIGHSGQSTFQAYWTVSYTTSTDGSRPIVNGSFFVNGEPEWTHQYTSFNTTITIAGTGSRTGYFSLSCYLVNGQADYPRCYGALTSLTAGYTAAAASVPAAGEATYMVLGG